MEMDAGTILEVGDLLRSKSQTFTRDETAYMVGLAYATGRRHRLHEELCDVASWPFVEDPPACRAQRIARRLDEYERLAGPPRYAGGPVDWETGQPVTGRRP